MEHDNVYFNIHKICAHVTQHPTIHHQRNNAVDDLARTANINYTDPLDYDKSYYDYYFNNNNNYINAYYNYKFNQACDKYESTMTGSKHLLSIEKTRELLHELRLFNYNESKILNRIRCGYLVSYKDPEWRPDFKFKCTCNIQQPLTIEHFLLECPKYMEARTLWREKLCESEPKYLENN